MAETTVQIECPCGWRLRISGWMAAYKAELLQAAHRCELKPLLVREQVNG